MQCRDGEKRKTPPSRVGYWLVGYTLVLATLWLLERNLLQEFKQPILHLLSPGCNLINYFEGHALALAIAQGPFPLDAQNFHPNAEVPGVWNGHIDQY
jgi:hypothetical protein